MSRLFHFSSFNTLGPDGGRSFLLRTVPAASIPFLLVLVATVCSLALTFITITPPVTLTDWAQFDKFGIYIPQNLGYNWPAYGIQVGFWLTLMGALWLAGQQLSAISSLKTLTPHTFGSPLPRPTAMLHSGEGERKRIIGLFEQPLTFNVHYGLVVVLTLVGFAIRLHALTRLPLIVDEIGFAAHASDILHGQQVPILAPGHYAHPSTHSWLVAGAMAIFGQTTFAIRLIPLVFGTVSIPAAYILGREWWSKRVGWMAAAFLTTYPVHVFYSRISMNNVEDPLFAMLALAYLARAIKTNQRKYFILAGIMGGVAQYFYHGARLVPILMAVYVSVTIFSQWQFRRGEAIIPLNIFWMVVAFALVALPCLAPTFSARLPITGNIQAIRLPKDFGANTVRSALAWVGQPDVSPFWLSNQPLLLWPTLLAFLIGLWWCLRGWRDPRCIVMLLSIVLTTIFGGAILTGSPVFVRYLATIPTIALLVALGIERVFSAARTTGVTVESKWRRRYAASRRYVGSVLLLTLLLYGGYVSFIVHPAQAFNSISPGHWEEDKLARQAATMPAEMAVVLAVSPEFDAEPMASRALELISLPHYVAAYGERRTVVLSHLGGGLTTEQRQELREAYVILRAQ